MRCDRTATRPDKKPGRESYFVNTKTSSKIVYLKMYRSRVLKRNNRAFYRCASRIRLGFVKSGQRKLIIGRSLLRPVQCFAISARMLGTNEIYHETDEIGMGRAEIATTGF